VGGASIDQSFLLEPSQVAGIDQSFRSIVPESIGGSQSGATFETFGLSVERVFPTRTYLTASGQILNSSETRSLGSFDYTGLSANGYAEPSTTPNPLRYSERTLAIALNQLVSKEWSLGLGYRLTDATLDDSLPDVLTVTDPAAIVGLTPEHHERGILHQINVSSVYNHREGFFSEFQALWNLQNNIGYMPHTGGSEFWQLNAFIGYRFPQRKAEIRVGILNLTDQNYTLNPLTLYNELPRSRTIAIRLRLKF
jgi:hypothetical protein